MINFLQFLPPYSSVGGEAIIYDESGGGGGVLLAAAAHVDLDGGGGGGGAHAHSATAAATTASAAAVVKPLVLSAEHILSVGGQESLLPFSLNTSEKFIFITFAT